MLCGLYVLHLCGQFANTPGVRPHPLRFPSWYKERKEIVFSSTFHRIHIYHPAPARPTNFTHKFRCGPNVSPSLAALNRHATTLDCADRLLPSLERGRGPRKNNSRSVLDPFPCRVVSKSLAPRFLVHLRRTVFSGLPSKIEQRLVIRS